MRRTPWFGALAGALLGAACATASPPPTSRLVESRAAVRVAEQNGADRDARAAQYLASARRQIADAQRLMGEGSHASANRMLEGAQLDAEMATELARQAKARAEAISARAEIDKLRTRTQ